MPTNLQPHVNRPFPSSKESHFQNEAKCETFVAKMRNICIIIENHFHINGFALNLALKVRFFGTRKWPIGMPVWIYHLCRSVCIFFRHIFHEKIWCKSFSSSSEFLITYKSEFYSHDKLSVFLSVQKGFLLLNCPFRGFAFDWIVLYRIDALWD